VQFTQLFEGRFHPLDFDARGADHRAIERALPPPPLAFLELRLGEPVGPFGEGARPMPAGLAGSRIRGSRSSVANACTSLLPPSSAFQTGGRVSRQAASGRQDDR
jgi:hypothetical protein